MTSHVVGPVLEEAPLNRFHPIGVFGRPAWQSHLQLRAILRQRLGERHADCFAIPTLDPTEGTIRWHSPKVGPVSRWAEMDSTQQQFVLADLRTLMGSVASMASEFHRGSSTGNGQAISGSGQALASLMAAAVQFPDDYDHVYLVSGQPVLTFWGFQPLGSVVHEAALPSVPRPLPALPEVAIVMATESSGVEHAPPQPEAFHESSSSLNQQVGAEHAPSASSFFDPLSPGRPPSAAAGTPAWTWPWWRSRSWLLAALLAALLLLLLAMGLRACGAPSVPVLPGLLDASVGSTSPQQSLELSRDAAASPPAPAAPLPITPPQAAAGRALARDLPGASSMTEPSAAGKAAGATGTGQPLNLKEPAARQGRPEFLEGRWEAGQGLFDRRTGQPLDLVLDFGKGGEGRITVKRPDGSVCSADVTAALSSGRLSISGSNQLNCPDDRSYASPRIECRQSSSGQTDCYGLNQDGTRYFMEIRRQ